MQTNYLVINNCLKSSEILAYRLIFKKIKCTLFHASLFGLFSLEIHPTIYSITLLDTEVMNVAECPWFLVQYEHSRGVSPGRLSSW